MSHRSSTYARSSFAGGFRDPGPKRCLGASSRKRVFSRFAALLTNVAPHWAPKSVTNISFILLVLLDTLQLATGATGLWSQGATAVTHGCSVHALVHNLGKEPASELDNPPWGCLKRKGITPDFIVEYFIEPLSSTCRQPSTEGWDQQSWLLSNSRRKPCKLYNKLGLQHH